MEFTNEIFFNKKLIQGETVLITYSGKLYKEYSAEITIVYGFGENWDYTQETKMQEKENGFEALITLKNYDTFNFCFKNNFNIWDNNSGFNYIASIEPAKAEEPEKIENITKEETDEKPEIIKEIKEQEENKNLENINSTESSNSQEFDESAKQAAIEEAFNNLLNSMMDFKEDETNKNVNLENGFGLQSVDEIKETDFTSCDKIFEDLYNELAKIDPTSETNIQTIETKENQNEATEQESGTAELENLLNDFSQKQEQKNKSINSEELDNLMDNILNSIEENEEKSSNVQEAKEEDSFELSGLLTVKHQSSFEDFIDKCIDGTYNFFKNVVNGCKKIGTLIKQKTQNLLGEDDK